MYIVHPHTIQCALLVSPDEKKYSLKTGKGTEKGNQNDQQMRDSQQKKGLKGWCFLLQKKDESGQYDIDLYNIVNRVERVNRDCAFSKWGHTMNLFGRGHVEYFFLQRIFDLQNSLPQDVAMASKLDDLLK